MGQGRHTLRSINDPVYPRPLGMYVCPKIYIRCALSKKVTVAPRSQTNRNVFSARLNRSVDKSAERREVKVKVNMDLYSTSS